MMPAIALTTAQNAPWESSPVPAGITFDTVSDPKPRVKELPDPLGLDVENPVPAVLPRETPPENRDAMS